MEKPVIIKEENLTLEPFPDAGPLARAIRSELWGSLKILNSGEDKRMALSARRLRPHESRTDDGSRLVFHAFLNCS
jgi:hypothetical protein